MKMKKFLALFMGVIMVFSLAACGNKNVADEPVEAPEVSAETTEAEEVVDEVPVEVEYVGLKLNSYEAEVTVPDEVKEALEAAVETEGITFVPVAYVAARGGEVPAYQFLCVGEGGIPAVDYEGYEVARENVKLFNVILEAEDGAVKVKDYYGFDFDGLLDMPEGEKTERAAAFKISGWEYFDEQPSNEIPEAVKEIVANLDTEIGNVVYFMGEIYNNDGSVVLALLCSDVVEEEAVVNAVFITTVEGEAPVVSSVTPVF